ncbi:MAG: hypothetical protein BWX68_02732 [Verrucomicrobia bacterium ADurb.Bin063]|nr:MAG: hypothetical protein BWX68_02732 [Verrucomicrobia bacterium ADurb.Bin063]
MLVSVTSLKVGVPAAFCSVYLLKSAEAAVLGVGTAWSLTVTRSPVYFVFALRPLQVCVVPLPPLSLLPVQL